MQNVSPCACELFVGQWSIAPGEVGHALKQLPDPSARPVRLIVNSQTRIDFLVNVRPFRLDGIDECRTAGVQLHGS